MGKEGRSQGHGDSGRTAAFQRQHEKGVRCKLTTGCRPARTNRASVLTAFGGCWEKHLGCAEARGETPRWPVSLPGPPSASHNAQPSRGAWRLPGSLVSVPFPSPDAALLSSTRSTKQNAQAAAPHAGTDTPPPASLSPLPRLGYISVDLTGRFSLT